MVPQRYQCQNTLLYCWRALDRLLKLRSEPSKGLTVSLAFVKARRFGGKAFLYTSVRKATTALTTILEPSQTRLLRRTKFVSARLFFLELIRNSESLELLSVLLQKQDQKDQRAENPIQIDFKAKVSQLFSAQFKKLKGVARKLYKALKCPFWTLTDVGCKKGKTFPTFHFGQNEFGSIMGYPPLGESIEHI